MTLAEGAPSSIFDGDRYVDDVNELLSSSFDAQRKQLITGHLPRHRLGLEVAPYFRPSVSRREFDVRYVDYVDNDEIQRKAAMNPPGSIVEIPTIDWVWLPGRSLRSCITEGATFSYAVASHVLEHVPNTIGWLNEILEVLEVGAPLVVALPDRSMTMDFYRRETTLAELVHNWIVEPANPTAMQVMDFLSQCFTDIRHTNAAQYFDPELTPFYKVPRHSTDEEAFWCALWVHNERQYLDAHCTVWTEAGFVDAIKRAVGLGLLNVSVSPSRRMRGSTEFVVDLVKLGEPRIRRSDTNIRNDADVLRAELAVARTERDHFESAWRHAEAAFRQATDTQGVLQRDLTRANELLGRVKGLARTIRSNPVLRAGTRLLPGRLRAGLRNLSGP